MNTQILQAAWKNIFEDAKGYMFPEHVNKLNDYGVGILQIAKSIDASPFMLWEEFEHFLVQQGDDKQDCVEIRTEYFMTPELAANFLRTGVVPLSKAEGYIKFLCLFRRRVSFIKRFANLWNMDLSENYFETRPGLLKAVIKDAAGLDLLEEIYRELLLEDLMWRRMEGLPESELQRECLKIINRCS